MTGVVPVIDLFSGPGGLAEGFSGFCDSGDGPRFRIALSIEMERSAHRTLRLRAFLRKFRPSELPREYHDFLNCGATDEPDWKTLYPKEWLEADGETQCLKLGTPAATAFVSQRVQRIRQRYGHRTVLIGGPPCQSYSLVGRARNAGNAAYDPNKDERQSLYRDYVRVLRELQPAVAILENVKGMLSARHCGAPIFHQVMADLRNAGGRDRYRLYAMASRYGGGFWEQDQDPRDFLVRAEEFGVPQARHRVIVACVRRSIADLLPIDALLRLERSDTIVAVNDVIGGMPMLRSRLSRGDSDASWQTAVASAYKLIRRIPRSKMSLEQASLFDEALARVRETTRRSAPPFRDAAGGTALSCPIGLSDWILDDKLNRLPNNETRGHMPEDLARYLFAAVFARATGRSPKSPDFPTELAPNHANWKTGKFGDRFRVQLHDQPSKTVTSHISKDGHYFIHPDPGQCRSLTVREAARLQTFPDNYFFYGGRTQQYVQVGNAVPPYLALQIAERVWDVLDRWSPSRGQRATARGTTSKARTRLSLAASPETADVS